jgi:hypothetical protein
MAPLGRLFPGLFSAFSPLPGGNVLSSEWTEHREIASVACPHAAISEQSFIHFMY